MRCLRTATLVFLGAALTLSAGLGCQSEAPTEAPPTDEQPPAEQQPAAKAPAESKPLAAQRQEAIDEAVSYLLDVQAPDGTWAEGNVGITALCTHALLTGGKEADDPPVKKAIDHLLAHQQDDGGIYDVGLKNYTTSIALMVLVKADPNAYAEPIAKAKDYLIEHQWDEAESIDKDHPWYGGAGYGKHGRPDMSNTGYFLEAMHQAGVPEDHPVWEKAVVFVSRTQARSESNDQVFVGTDDGGLIYSPHDGGESKVAEKVTLPDGRKALASYGSMTYAGLKSFIYAGLSKNDPRVKAAMEWILDHWTWEENPGMGLPGRENLGQQGLYYYYMVAARALNAWGRDVLVDDRQREHRWRQELTRALLRRQRDDGSWINEADRWFEGLPPIPTSYAIVALVECSKESVQD